MERKIGEVFKYTDEITLRVIPGHGTCRDCFFENDRDGSCRLRNVPNVRRRSIGECDIHERTDGMDARFIQTQQKTKDLEQDSKKPIIDYDKIQKEMSLEIFRKLSERDDFLVIFTNNGNACPDEVADNIFEFTEKFVERLKNKKGGDND